MVNSKFAARIGIVARSVGVPGGACSFALGWVLLAPHAALAQVPFVATPMKVVQAMLEIAKVGPRDFVIDLGSGDGRIVIAAAKRGARGLGVDLDGALVSDARREAARQGVAGAVQFQERNIFVTDLDQATVVTAYLYPQLLMQLRPKLLAELKPGSRVVLHEFDFGNWKSDGQVRVAVPDKPYGPPWSDVFLWIVPANAAGRWQWQVTAEGAPRDYEVTFEQIFQELRGAARSGGRPASIEQANLRGEEIRFTVAVEVNGRPVRHELVGRVTGDTIRGKMRVANAESAVEWQATRTVRGKIEMGAAAGVSALAANH